MREATIRKFRTVQQEGSRNVTRTIEHYSLDAIISVGCRVNSLCANSSQPNMGLTSWAKGPEGKILKTDVGTAKNYLNKDELDSLGRIVNAYLELAEDRAKRKIPMTMEDWAKTAMTLQITTYP